MMRFTWGVLAAAGVSFAVPAYAEDPPADGSAEEMIRDQEAEARAGAGSMEPQDAETDEERVEREFVANVWNSP